MSDNYPSDVKLDENPDGSVSFATGVVETIAGLAAQEVEGVASMASISTGFADMFTRKSTRNLTKGVRVDIDGGTVAVDVTIVVEYGSPIPDVARSIQENVKKAIETMSGLDVRNVDVHVQAVSFEREHRAAQELKEHQQKLLENRKPLPKPRPRPRRASHRKTRTISTSNSTKTTTLTASPRRKSSPKSKMRRTTSTRPRTWSPSTLKTSAICPARKKRRKRSRAKKNTSCKDIPARARRSVRARRASSGAAGGKEAP